jgi:hypothetical protein
LHHLSKRDFVHCCFSDAGPVRGASVSLAGVRETFTKADIEADQINPRKTASRMSALEGTSAALASHIDMFIVRDQAEPPHHPRQMSIFSAISMASSTSMPS